MPDYTEIQEPGCDNLQNRVLRSNLMRFQGILGEIFNNNRCFKCQKKKKEIGKTTIGISKFCFLYLKTGSMLNGFDFCVVNLP